MHYFLWVILLSVVACNRPPSPLVKETQTAPELTDSLVLITIFGNVQRKTPTSERTDGHFFANSAVDSTHFSLKNWQVLDFGKIKKSTEYFVEQIENITEDSIKKKLVILSAMGFSCHACPGIVGAAVFSLHNNKWSLETWENDIAVIGTTGYPVDQIEIKHAGKNVLAIILKKGSIWQGVEYRFFTMVLYQKGVFKEVLEETIGFSANNWANAEGDDFLYPAYSYTASIAFDWTQDSSSPSPLDMLLHFQGTILNKKTNKPELLDNTIRFEFKDGQYKAIEKIPE